jgi:hypothetical protein
MVKFYVDFEFHEFFVDYYKGSFFNKKKISTHTIQPMEVAIVDETGKVYHYYYNDFDVNAAWDNVWLKDNVLFKWFENDVFSKTDHLVFNKQWVKSFIKLYGYSRQTIAYYIQNIAGTNPEFYGYYADYNWVALCNSFGTMVKLPNNFTRYCKDIKQMLDDFVTQNHTSIGEVVGYHDYPQNDDEHDCVSNATFNKNLHEWLLKQIKQ